MACKNGCVIAEGFARSTLSNGPHRVIHGMVTTGGCPLESTLNDIDGVGNEGGDAIAATLYQTPEGTGCPSSGRSTSPKKVRMSKCRRWTPRPGEPIADLAYSSARRIDLLGPHR